MLSEGKLEELEKVALAATAQTPDTWFVDRSQDPIAWTDGLVVAAADRYGTALAHVTRGWEGDPQIPESSHGLALATHIATFDPPTVLALISELRALRAERDEADRQRGVWADRALADAKRAQAAEAELAALRAQAPAPVGVVEALRPFADIPVPSHAELHWPINYMPVRATYADVVGARKALAALSPDPTEGGTDE